MLRLTWVRLGLFSFGVALAAPACTDDEAQHMGAAGGTSSSGNGAGGNGGTATNASGGSSASGNATTGGTTTQLGIACESNRDCPSGLTCLSSASDDFFGGGPAHGFCTFECAAAGEPATAGDGDCQRYDSGSLCRSFGEVSYCVQRCTFGSSTAKCQGRDDVVCDVVLHETSASCRTDADCDIGDSCQSGTCFRTPQVCLPRCNSELDCPAGRFCDPASGACVDEEPTGKRFGESCDPNASEDECAGFCDEGVCYEKCILLSYPACGSTSEEEATADCLWLPYSNLSGGDVGLCGQLCDCSDDCRGDFDCVQLEDEEGPFDYRGRPGLCDTAQVTDTVLNDCDGAAGAAGAAGASGRRDAAGR